MLQGATFNFGTAKVCSPPIFETCFSYTKDIWIAATDYYTFCPPFSALVGVLTVGIDQGESPVGPASRLERFTQQVK